MPPVGGLVQVKSKEECERVPLIPLAGDNLVSRVLGRASDMSTIFSTGSGSGKQSEEEIIMMLYLEDYRSARVLL
jgi:hypothetical protein